MKKLVIIPGGFHPYHAGHKALYDAAREAFPSADIYVAATDDTTGRPFPFKTKKFLAQQAGIPGNRFIQVKSPFSAEEITQHFDPNETQLIFVRSEKDRDQNPQPGQPGQVITRGPRKGLAPYLQPYKRNGLQPMKDHSYMTYLPTVQFGPGMTSATEIRAKWPGMDSKQKTALASVLYPLAADNPAKIAKVVEILDTVMGSDTRQINELDILRKESDFIKMPTGQFIDVGYRVTDKMSQPGNPYVTNAEMRWVPDQEVRTLDLEKRIRDMSRNMDGNNVFTFNSRLIPPAVKTKIAQWVKTNPAPTTEAVLVNDPDAGHQIIPDGGMGTWDESSMVNNLARKFADMVNMVKSKNYSGLQYVLYKGGVVKSLVDALAEYERFMQKQGRRPIAKGREIDLGQTVIDENPDYIEEGEVVQFPGERTAPENLERARELAERILAIAKDETIADPGPRLAPLRQELQRLGYRLRMDNGGMRLIHNVTNWNTIVDPMK